jgi:hypothetical protein
MRNNQNNRDNGNHCTGSRTGNQPKLKIVGR